MDTDAGLSKPLFSREDEFPRHKYDEELFDPFEEREEKTDPYSHVYPPGAQSSDVALTSHKPHSWDVPDRSEYPAIPFLVRLPALVIAFGAAGLGGAIIIWVSSRRYDVSTAIVSGASFPGKIVVWEPTSLGAFSDGSVAVGLIMSSITTQFLSWSGSYLLSIVAYRLGADWYRVSQNNGSRNELPTPLQYGMVMDLLSAGGIMTIARSAKYLQRNRGRSTLKLLKDAFAFMITIFLLGRLVGLTDLILHSTTKTTALPGLPGNNTQAFGTAFNESAVALGNSGYIQRQGALAAINSSSTHQIFTLGLDDQMAYIARLSSGLPSDVSFIASSLGIVSQCEPITVQCFSLPSTLRPTPMTENGADPFDCSPAGYPAFTHTSNFTMPNMLGTTTEYLNGTAQGSAPLSLAHNPFTAIFINYILGGSAPDTFQYYNDSLIEAFKGYRIIAACNISVYDIVLRYAQGNYTLDGKTPSTPNLASFLVQPLSLYDPQVETNNQENTFIAALTNNIITCTAANRDELGQFLSGEMARLLLAYSSGYLQPTSAIASGSVGIITLYPIVPLACTLVSIFAYAGMALFVFFWSTTKVSAGAAPGMTIYANKQQLCLGLAANAYLYVVKPATLVAQLCRRLQGFAHPKRGESAEGWVRDSVNDLFDENATRVVSRLSMGMASHGSRRVHLSVVDSARTAENSARGVAFARVDFSSREPTAEESLLIPRTRRPPGTGPAKIRIPFTWLVPILAVAAVSFMLATGLLVWLFSRRYHSIVLPFSGVLSSSSIAVREPSKNSDEDPHGTILVGLLISSVTTQFVSLTGPLLLVAAASRIGLDWLGATIALQLDSLPSAQQYGHILNLLQSGGWGALQRVSSYLLRRERRPQAPRMLIQAFAAFSTIYTLMHLIGLADLALHSTTTTDTVSAVNRVDTSASAYAYGTEVNMTKLYPPEDLIPSLGTYQEGISTAENRSAINQVFSLDSEMQMAYIARLSSSIPGDISFLASTFGVESQCSSITHQCFNASQAQDINSGLNCSDAGYPYIASASKIPVVLAAQSQYDNFTGLENPFTVFYENYLLQTPDAYQYGELLLNVNMANESQGSYLIMTCNITLYNLTLQYTQGNYMVVNKTVTEGLATPFLGITLQQNKTGYRPDWESNINMSQPIIPRLAADIEDLANVNAADFFRTISPNIARYLLSYSAGVLQPANAAIVATDGVVSRYRTAALAAYILLVYLYAIVAFVIFAWAFMGRITIDEHSLNARGISGASILEQARNLISQPSALVDALFEQRSNGDENREALADRTRLSIGFRSTSVVNQGETQERLTYGVWVDEGSNL
ncbi:hypothetical protein FIBSPDRAFT_1041294 [Athelia psychrophila]|uniref:Uncharacterized protein n=1 Tax=Athelia psychrophila TaxID=1759441 RepID=A0A166P3X4_9AGAM|nr:hypothetical protein FIBSPDRAFT_1041294 [Fibularhizoctonia sp. CBS 109695]